MTPPKPIDYAMVRVKLDQPETDCLKAFEQIKATLKLSSPDIDEKYGAIPNRGTGQFVVLIEEKLAQRLLDEGHPNVTGVFANPKQDTFFTHGGCVPPSMRKRPHGPKP